LTPARLAQEAEGCCCSRLIKTPDLILERPLFPTRRTPR
jgi:hypothetical protein